MKLINKCNLCISIFFVVLNISSSMYFCHEKYNLENLTASDQDLALSLLQIYTEVKNAEEKFYKKHKESEKIFSEIKSNNKNELNELNELNNLNDTTNLKETVGIKSKNIIDSSVNGHIPSANTTNTDSTTNITGTTPTTATSFVQLQLKGPVEEETIWRAMYDTQLRRSPPTEEVNIFSTENVKKEYEEAKMDAFVSQIKFMQINFEKQLHSMNEELPRKNRIRNILNEAISLERTINK
ncbi:conserved protein, unknown function [Hepatocystis sp. ex Piliocolobus tephrosceles]|nr:conserved protein, unknown function [Hepatocystis sp. ex Piliocolobus tephrosceles]